MLREGIAYLLQGHSVFPGMTVEENLELGGWILKGDRAALARAFEEVYAPLSRAQGAAAGSRRARSRAASSGCSRSRG